MFPSQTSPNYNVWQHHRLGVVYGIIEISLADGYDKHDNLNN